MHVAHVALWTHDLERLRGFYVDALGGVAGRRYENPRTGFSSYFVSFGAETVRLELMTRREIAAAERAGRVGYSHVAFALGSRDAVDAAVTRLRAAGVTIEGEPRITGDGYYEAVILDPDGNLVELVA